MATVDTANVAAREEDHKERDNDVEPDARARAKGAVFKVSAGQCARYGRRFQACAAAPEQHRFHGEFGARVSGTAP